MCYINTDAPLKKLEEHVDRSDNKSVVSKMRGRNRLLDEYMKQNNLK